MTQGINSANPIQNTAAIAALVSESAQGKEGINSRVAVAGAKNSKENTIKDKQQGANHSSSGDHEDKKEEENKKGIEFRSIVAPIINTQEASSIGLQEGFNKYKKAKEIFEVEENS